MAGAYEVTATRKRPQDFDKLVGQDFVVSTLENAIKEGRIAHAYLFSGPRGVGKTSSARLLAKALNCEKGPTPHPCGECDSCKAIAIGQDVDVIEIDGASNTSVNDIRAIKEEVMYPPQSSRYKIYIIDEVHMLSTSAFNALLKTIEEPPEYIIFIFATTELQKVPATIRSRCQQFRFHLISQEEIMKCLRSAAEDLGIEADEDALFWIARESTGSMRDAYTLFDQVAAFSGKHITLSGIREKLSIAGFGAISNIVEKTLRGKSEETLSAIAKLFEDGVSADQIVKDSAEFFRTLLLYSAGIRRPEILGAALSDIPENITSLLTREQIEAALKAFLDLYRDLRYSLSPRYEIELLFTRLSALPSLVSKEEIVRRMEELKKGVVSGSVVVKTAPLPSIPVEKKTPIAKAEEKQSEIADQMPINVSSEPSETPAEDEEKNEEEEAGDELTITPNAFPSIAEALRKMGKISSARYITSIDRIEKDDNGFFIFIISKPLAFNTLKNDEKSIEKATASALGEEVHIKLRFEEKEKDEEVFSEQMKALRAFFGGNLSHTKKKETKKEEEINHVTDNEPVRVDENDGLAPEPDEED